MVLLNGIPREVSILEDSVVLYLSVGIDVALLSDVEGNEEGG